MLFQVYPARWVWIARTTFLRATFAFTILSALHYIILVQRRMKALPHPAAASD